MALVGTSKLKHVCKVFIVFPYNVTITMKTYWYNHLHVRKYENTTNEAKLLYMYIVCVNAYEI